MPTTIGVRELKNQTSRVIRAVRRRWPNTWSPFEVNLSQCYGL